MFWEQVKELIKERGLTQEAVAHECGIPFATFRGWISKGILPKVDAAAAIAVVLNTSVEFLVYGTSDEELNKSHVRKKFYAWAESMTDNELTAVVDFLEAVDRLGPGPFLKGLK